jgi:NSS family neurotransmitter:Na+ symporter
MLIVVLVTCLYAGWAINTAKVADEISEGSPYFKTGSVFGLSPARVWIFFIRFVCPLICGLVLLSVLGLF